MRPLAKPRRGRVVDLAFMEFAREAGCVLSSKHDCVGPITFHHVRTCGSPKDDHCGIGLCAAGHLYQFSPYSIERMGKTNWQAYWGVDLQEEIERLRAAYDPN